MTKPADTDQKKAYCLVAVDRGYRPVHTMILFSPLDDALRLREKLAPAYRDVLIFQELDLGQAQS